MCKPLLLGRTGRCKHCGCPSGAPSLGFCGDRVQPDYPRVWERMGREKDISFCQRPAKSTHPLYCTSGFVRPLRKCCRLHRRLEWPWPFSEKKSAGHHYPKKKYYLNPFFFRPSHFTTDMLRCLQRFVFVCMSVYIRGACLQVDLAVRCAAQLYRGVYAATQQWLWMQRLHYLFQ